MNGHVRKAVLCLLALGLAGAAISCSGKNGSQGAPGAPAVDHGSIAGTVKDALGVGVSGATVTTYPVTVTAQTDGTGGFTLASIPIGVYAVTATKTGYSDGHLDAVGVAAGATVQVTVAMAATLPTPGSISGIIKGLKTGGAAALVGAQVCVEGTTTCATTAAGGTYTISGVAPGFAFVSATATGYLPGETRSTVFVPAGTAVTAVNITLSGRPPDAAAYVGSAECMLCHSGLTPDVVTAWQASAHASAFDRTTGHVDWTGWPAQPAGCTAPNVADSGVAAADPVDGLTREVYLVRWGAGCGAGKPAFAMAFDPAGALDALPVTGSAGGVATGAGACGNGGIVPAGAPCASNPGGAGATATKGWWQQEYLIAIGPSVKPAWVTWNTTNTPDDALVLPLAWNQRTRSWIAAPDYATDQASTWSQRCSGCHEGGLQLTLDANGFVATYSSKEAAIGCEKCHGPGSGHASSGDPQLIVSPRYLTAQAEREVCGQCHSQGVSSVSPAGAFGFAWNDTATVGGGNFIPGVHALANFEAGPSYGDPAFYWPAGFPSSDHLTAQDFGASIHANNPYDKLTCAECHSGHGGTGGPLRFDRTDETTGDDYAFESNDAALRDDVVCLACHASHGPSFGSLTLQDAARYHLTMGGTVLLNGAAWAPTAAAQATSASLVATTVTRHMLVNAGMPAYFDPTGVVGGPVGRCSSCHMPKTAFTGSFFALPDLNGIGANAIGDVTAHTFRVAWPDASLATFAAATSWDGVMPNSCGACHAGYRFGK